MSIFPFTVEDPVVFRAPGIVRVLIFLLAYLPVLLGGGDCVSLCISPKGPVTLDYHHHCGLETDLAAASRIAGQRAFLGLHHHHGCTDLPLVIGSAFHSVTKGHSGLTQCAASTPAATPPALESPAPAYSPVMYASIPLGRAPAPPPQPFLTSILII